MTWKYTVEQCGAEKHDGECGPWSLVDVRWGDGWRDAYRKAEKLPHAIVSREYKGDMDGWNRTPHTVFEHIDGGDTCKGCYDRSQVTGEPLDPESRGPLVQTPRGNEFMCAPCQSAFRTMQKKFADAAGRSLDRWLYVPIIDTVDFT